MIVLDLSILNQKGTPMFNSDTLANRPAAGIVGRIFIAIDSPFGIYRDTGTAWDQISGASTFSGSLATGQVAFGSATNTISGTNNLFWNNSINALGIGTNAPIRTLDVNGQGNFRGLLFTPAGIFCDTALARFTNVTLGVNAGASGVGLLQPEDAGQSIGIRTGAAFGGTIRFLVQAATGNVLIQNGGSFVDSGQRLQVTGDTKVTGIVEVGNYIKSLTNIPVSIQAHVGAGNILSLQYFTGDGTQGSNTHNVIASSINFRPTSGNAIFNQILFSPTINQTGGANGITRGIWIAPTITAAADWRSFEWSNNTGWGLYGAGSALNYLGGTLGIKTTSPYSPSTFSLDVNGGLLVKNTAGTTAQITLINANPALGGNEGFLVTSVGGTSGSSYAELQGYYGTSITGSTALRLNPAGGAVIINSTTNSGEQFQLTGTLRINGQQSATSGGNSGQHLIINLDGTQYKIKLELP